MKLFGTPEKNSPLKILLLGFGELGKEVVIEAQRLGVEVVAVDHYKGAPAMQVAHRFHVCDMQDAKALEALIRAENPSHIVPEVEAIATEVLVDMERQGFNIVPSAKAVNLTMNRQGIRDLVAKKLGLPTSEYSYACSYNELVNKVGSLGFPCVVKPIMSSSGKGQSILRSQSDIEKAWQYAMDGARGKSQTVIVERFLEFDYEITLLTVRHCNGTSFCEPIGHEQIDGDYRTSWQPQAMSMKALNQSRLIAKKVTDALGGYGLFGVELFIKGDDVYFNEVSPRPHDTGMVTMISQELSEFALHIRAILGLPIPEILQYGPSASSAILLTGESDNPEYYGIEQAVNQPGTQIRLFGKPSISGKRRMGVALATG